MAIPHYQLLAESLKNAKKNSERGVIRAENMSRADRNRLKKNGWLVPVVKGWFLLKQPELKKGDSTVWYSSFWDFISVYLHARFGKNYCLAANASIDVHVGTTTIPKQLLVMVKKGGSSVIHLPFNTSILIYQETHTFPSSIEQIKNIQVMPLATALYRAPPKFFQAQAEEALIALKFVDTSAIARELLSGNNIASSNRIIGAYRAANDTQRADQLEANLISAGYQVSPINPFDQETQLTFHSRTRSPYAARISMMWQEMREDILAIFPKEPGLPKTSKKYFVALEKIYVNDAYNSLSIEGYEVSEELITKIASGKWNPEQSLDDKNQINAMAAKGYRETFERVKKSIADIFEKKNPGLVIKHDLHAWHSALFSAAVKSGIIKPEQLAGYRTQQVYIRGSMHTPLPKDALMDAMETFFECLMQETSAAVRAVLGHFMFVFIHPYMDGNGRLGRFIMNALFASGGFPWTIITVTNREKYMKALESASVERDIKPLAKFVLSEMVST